MAAKDAINWWITITLIYIRKEPRRTLFRRNNHSSNKKRITLSTKTTPKDKSKTWSFKKTSMKLSRTNKPSYLRIILTKIKMRPQLLWRRLIDSTSFRHKLAGYSIASTRITSFCWYRATISSTSIKPWSWKYRKFNWEQRSSNFKSKRTNWR